MLRNIVLAGAAVVPCLPLVAQGPYSLVLAPDTRMVLLNAGNAPIIEDCDDQESFVVTPNATTPYVARAWHTFSSWNIQYGDGDNDSSLSDATNDIMGTMNVLFVRRRAGNEDDPRYPGDLFVSGSFNTTTGIATSAGGVQNVRDGDCYRARNGVLEYFVTETSLTTALGDSSVEIDLDALCQDPAGNLYFSITDTTSIAGTSYSDGSVIYIPATAITYDAQGMVASITPNTAVLFANESDMSALVANSGSVDSAGNPGRGVSDVTGLDLDPNGGVWQSPQDPNLLAPNLLFVSNFSVHFDNVWSTAVNPSNSLPGSLAVINGKTMGHTSGLPDGSVLGVGIDITGSTGQDALNGLVVMQADTNWIAAEAPNQGEPVLGQFTASAGRVTPGSAVAFIFDAWTNDFGGGWVSGTPNILPFPGNRFIDIQNALIVQFVPADANGYATLTFPQPMGVPAGIDVLAATVGFAFESGNLAIGQTVSFTTL